MSVIETIEFGRPSPNAAYQSRARATRALVMAMAADPRARGEALAAQSIATRQGAHLWRELASLVVGFLSGQTSAAVMTVPSNLHCVISFAAELVASRLATLDSSATSVVEEEAHLRPQRWLPLIRRLAASVGDPSAPPAARLLDKVGQLGDVAFLRSLAREPKASPGDRRLGKTLARRLAAIAVVEDLGRVHIRIGAQEVGGQDVRRKVLSLLCFLLTRPRISATREEVMDAMWPEMDPSAAVNSLNQSVYYLRRVFEPEYSEDLSPGYVHQDSDLLWLDDELVTSRSRSVASLVADYERAPSSEGALAISDRYTGRFALDFMYDDWSMDFRDWLHVAYLRVVETEVRAAMNSSRFDVGILMARRALEIDPRHEELELLLLRLLRNSGSHSAAAEQYARYASFMRDDLGIEPPPLDSV
jgi:DNA-binding SARP family transcriptional activator